MKANYIIASGLIASVLAGAPLALAHDAEGKGEANVKFGLHLGQLLHSDSKVHAKIAARHDDDRADRIALTGKVTAKSATTLTVVLKDGAVYTVNAANAEVKGDGTLADIVVGDSVLVKGEVNGTTITAKIIADVTAQAERREALLSHMAVGTVTSVNGSVFTIDPIGSKSTTTVTTNSNTTLKLKGNATTTAALTVGTKVFVHGTTTATSTTGDSITASLVKVLGKGFGHLKFWFGLN